MYHRTMTPLTTVALVCLALATAGCIFDTDDGDDGRDPYTARVYRVKPGATGGDGADWSTAFGDINAALQAAGAQDGAAEIWIAAGTYGPTSSLDKSAFINMVDDTGLYGGFAGTETARGQRDWIANETILDGGGAEHVVIGDLISGGTLDGFTITGGNHSEEGGRGGGAYFVIATAATPPTIRNCRFVDNHAEQFGGGLYINRSTRIVNCDFVGNTSGTGAGLFMHGTENEPMVVANCRFLGNGNDEDMNSGGGMEIWSGGETTVVNCLFSGNRADFGAGLCLVSLSEADTTTVCYCTFAGNVTTLIDGAGGLNASDSDAGVYNSIFWDNREYYGPRETAQIKGRNLRIRYCTIDSLATLAATGNNAGDPAFIDADGPDDIYGTLDDNLRQSGVSLAGAGDIALVPPDVADLDGDGVLDERTPVNLANEMRGGTAGRGAY